METLEAEDRDLGGRILLVDDDESLRHALAEMIDQADGLAVSAAVGSAEEALERLDEVHPDLAVVDISLPGANGITLTRLLRRRLPGLPVLVLSSLAPAQMERPALAAGALAYLNKPHAIVELIAIIRSALDRDDGLEHRHAHDHHAATA